MTHRKEKDSLGEVHVPDHKYYGAQTQRSLENFPIGSEKISLEVIYALALVKKAAAIVNAELGLLSKDTRDAICDVVDEILAGKHDSHFPLSVWQTGSGTQTNMNVNEVISNRAIEKLGGEKGSKSPIHPNDHVNRSQSSNDAFPTAMRIATMLGLRSRLIPSLQRLEQTLEKKSEEFSSIIKVGRTHLMDAVPLTLGQEFSGYASQVHHGIRALENTLVHLSEIPLGGTAVGTGINSHPDYADRVAEVLSELTEIHFISAPNKFEALASEDVSVEVMGALSRIAVSLMKIANDIRWMGSGPRCGLGELLLPANEPGSSIMPGKVNPTQSESLTMVCAQVLGNQTSVSIGASQGNFELNVFRPMIIYNLLQSIELLQDSVSSFCDRCVTGIRANEDRIAEHLERSLMLATILNRELGYDQAAKIVQKAYSEDTTLKEAAVSLGLLTEEAFDRLVQPHKMLRP